MWLCTSNTKLVLVKIVAFSKLTFHLFAILKFEPATFCAFYESLYLGEFFTRRQIHASRGVILVC